MGFPLLEGEPAAAARICMGPWAGRRGARLHGRMPGTQQRRKRGAGKELGALVEEEQCPALPVLLHAVERCIVGAVSVDGSASTDLMRASFYVSPRGLLDRFYTL